MWEENKNGGFCLMLSIIVATDLNNTIGLNNVMPWHLSQDLAFFKRTTLNKTVIIGRKTFEGMGKPLPKRNTIIVTRDEDFHYDHPNVIVEHDLVEVFNRFKNSEEEVFIIGGAKIYKEGLKYADKIYLTKIYKQFLGDTYFPKIDKSFKKKYSSPIFYDPKSKLKYNYNTYLKNQ